MVFQEKYLVEVNGPFGSQNYSASSKCQMHSKDLLSERGQETYEIYISDFCKEDLFEGEWVIVGPKMLCPQNSGYVLVFCICNGIRCSGIFHSNV